MEPKYTVFVRNWYKRGPNGTKVPGPGPKTTLARHLSYSAARDYCEVYNKNHNPGKYSRKAEFTQE